MLDKQNSQTFIQRLSRVNKFDMASTASIWLVCAIQVFFLVRSLSAAPEATVSNQINLALTLAGFFVAIYFMWRSGASAAKLACPKCGGQYYGAARRALPRSRCQHCKVELHEIEQAAELKVPIAHN